MRSMERPIHPVVPAVRVVAVLMLCWSISGCGEPPAIREYTVPKPPAPGSLWFFKVIGPADAVTAVAKPLRSFLESVEFNAKTGLPEWTLPEGWSEETPSNAVRYKTIKIPGDDELEIAVTQIGTKIPMASDDVRMQANLLREQVGLEATEASDDEASPGDELIVGSQAGTLFDFTGETTRYGETRLLAAMVPLSIEPSAGTVTSRGEVPFTYEAPDEWEEAPQTQFSIVSMTAGSGEASASMTVTRALGGPLDNVNRWRGQAGLEPIEQAQLVDVLEPVEVEGITMLYTEAVGESRGILGAMVPFEAGTYFVKLDGPPEVVNDERERFREFLESFRAVE